MNNNKKNNNNNDKVYNNEETQKYICIDLHHTLCSIIPINVHDVHCTNVFYCFMFIVWDKTMSNS